MLFKYFQFINSAGTQYATESVNKKRIRLVNQVLHIAFLASLIFAIIYFVTAYYFFTILTLLTSLLFFCTYIINIKGHFHFSRIFMFIIALTSIFISASLTGRDLNLQLYLFPILAGVFAVFSTKEKALMFFVIFVILSTYISLEIFNYEFLLFLNVPVIVHTWIANLNLFIALFITALVVYHSHIENLNYEKQLLRERNQLNATISNTHESIWFLDKNYKLILYNSIFENWIERAFNEKIKPGQNIIELAKKYDKEVSVFWKKIYDQVFQQGKSYNFEQKMNIGDKFSIIAEFSLNPVLENKQVVGISAFGRDITTRYNMEKQLIKARHSAEQASLAKSKFLSNMSHELRTPVNGIYGLAQLLLKKTLNEDIKTDLTNISDSAEFLVQLIDNVLDYSAIDSGNLKLEIKEFKLTELIRNIKNEFLPKFIEKGIEFSVDMKPDLPPVLLGDVKRVGMIIEKLLDNALKFTHQGFVKVLIDEKQRTQNSVTLNISVEDSGIGIAKNKKNIIFDAFSLIDNETTRSYSSSGLGLAIFKKILEAHNGSFYLESTLGKGSVFGFEITLKIKAAENDDKNIFNQFIDNIDISDKHILIVDDNNINILVAKKMIEQIKANVTTAENGAIALEKINTQDFDLILLDLHMPVMDGFEVAKNVRNQKNSKSGVPIVAISADVLPETKIKATNAGMNDFIEKPYSFEYLTGMVFKYIKK